MNKILVDTSVVIDFLRQKEKQDTWYYELAPQNLCISIITHSELYAGKSVWQYKNAQKELETILSGVSILSLNKDISKKAGKIKAQQKISLLDALIAATALEHKLQLATLNVKDFKNIPKLKLMKTKKA